MDQFAVLTGDLIGSTQAGAKAVDHAMTTLAEAARKIDLWNEDKTRFTRFRGDGWQIYLDFPGNAFRASLFLLASLKGSGCTLGTRISIGVGAVESLGTDSLADARGEAFSISGHGLDYMHRAETLTFSTRTPVSKWIDAIIALTQFQTDRWSQEQAQAVALALDQDNKTVEELARPLGITRQAMQARLKGAGFHALTNAIYAFQSYDYLSEPDHV